MSSFFKFIHGTTVEEFNAKYKDAKSSIERNDNGEIVKIILRDRDWPNYNGILSFGEEWIIESDQISITTIKKRGTTQRIILLDSISNVEVTNIRRGCGVLRVYNLSKPKFYAGFSFNAGDFLVAHAAAVYISQRRHSCINNDSLSVDIHPEVVRARREIDEGTVSVEILDLLKKRGSQW